MDKACACCGHPPTHRVRYKSIDGEITATLYVCSNCRVPCLYCGSRLPAFEEFKCTECEAYVCVDCAFAKLGKPRNDRQCLSCTSAMVKARMRQVGAKVEA